jgi:hypothetical protein
MKPAPRKYRTTNWKTYNEALKARSSLLIWLDPKMNWHDRPSGRLGRAIWKKWSGYHRRSLVDTKMRCFKLLGERVTARDFDHQVAERQVRAAVQNRFTRLAPRLRSQCYKTNYK